jgi:hypothetical protein
VASTLGAGQLTADNLVGYITGAKTAADDTGAEAEPGPDTRPSPDTRPGPDA